MIVLQEWNLKTDGAFLSLEMESPGMVRPNRPMIAGTGLARAGKREKLRAY
jgi:hypothetical protein